MVIHGFGVGGAGELQARLVGTKERRNTLGRWVPGEPNSPGAPSSGKTLAMGLSGEHGGSLDW